MANNQTPAPENPQVAEYKRTGKFLDIVLSTSLVQVNRIQKFRAALVEITVPSADGQTNMLLANDYVGQLADYLGIHRDYFYQKCYDRDIEWLQGLMDASNRLIKFSAHTSEDGTWWVHTVATHRHITVPYRSIGKIVKDKLGELTTVEQKFWEKEMGEFSCAGNQFNTLIRVFGGDNKTKNAIKVSVLIRVRECNNSICAADYTPIKRTEGWAARLEKALDNAVEIAATTEATIRAAVEKEISLKEGFEILDKIKLPIRKPEKVEYVRELLKTRFQMEYGKDKTLNSIIQATSWVGTHDDPAQSSARTLVDLQAAAFQVAQIYK